MFLTLQDPISCSLLGSSVHGILHAIIPDWVAIPSSRGYPNPEIEPPSSASPWQVDSLTWSHQGRLVWSFRFLFLRHCYFLTSPALLLLDFSSTATSWLDFRNNESDSFPGHCYQSGFVLHCQKCLIPKHLLETIRGTCLTLWMTEAVMSVTQSCPTVCNPLDYSPPGSSVHGILQERILVWVAMPFSRGSSQYRGQT